MGDYSEAELLASIDNKLATMVPDDLMCISNIAMSAYLGCISAFVFVAAELLHLARTRHDIQSA